VTVAGADAGLHVVAWFNRVPRAEEADLVARARASGLGIYPITPLYADAPADTLPASAGLVMGYACLDEDTIRRGVQMLGDVLRA
jgi:GntR family transcriptional regulator/MocR family aminotransferase